MPEIVADWTPVDAVPPMAIGDNSHLKVADVVKSVEEAEALSVQSRAREKVDLGGQGLVLMLANAGEIISPWWSKQRDRELRRFWMKSDHMSGAFYTIIAKLTSVPVHVEARDPTIKAHRRQAEQFTQALVEESDFAGTWMQTFSKFLLDLWTTDNGGFWEVIGRGDPKGPIEGAAVGLASLDSARVDRTSSPEYPIVYTDKDSRRYMLHRTRVVALSQVTSPDAEMNGVGFCWLSRAINTAQALSDIGVYKQEKLGSRPLRAIMLGKMIREGLLQSAMAQSAAAMDARGQRRYSRVPIVEGLPAEASLDIVNLASLPDGFDEQQSTTLGMYVIALTGGVPPRWLWPATTTGATKADAMYQHIAGIGGGAGQTLQAVSTILGGSPRGMRHSTGRFLPPYLKLVFDFQDDEQDRNQADIAEVRSVTRERELAAGTITIRIAREKALEAGDLTQAEFDQLEIEDGRLPDGTDAIVLWEDPNTTSDLLNIGVSEPLAIRDNDPQMMIDTLLAAERQAMLRSLRAGTAGIKKEAEQARAALIRLRVLYEEELDRDVMPAMLREEEMIEDEAVLVDAEPTPEQEPEPEPEEEEEYDDSE